MSTPRPWAAPKTRKTRRMVNASQREELTHDRGGPSGYIQRKLQTRVSSLESTVCPPQTQEGSQQPFPRGFLPRLTEWRGTWEQQDATERGARGQDKNKIICKPDEKDPRSEAYLRRLHQMYSASLANMDFSRRLLERNGWFADVDPEGRAGDLLDYLIPSGHGLRGVRPGPRGRRTGDVGPPGQHGPPPTALPTLRFLKGDSPAGKTEDPNRKTRGHRAARCGMIKLPEHKRGGQDSKTILDQLCGPGMRLASCHDGKDEEMLKFSKKQLNGRFLFLSFKVMIGNNSIIN
ncbi:uncharacterized protein LOC123836817 [Mirounga angustirostris]|uniref:uncharacterized protein LOC123836817 n=1 Tax=Mirounga angustirostris TaxID=9716 RepID=UPI001E68D856|nr:uncharacterized protein LOC123836817 isoform X3 [Mirounga angustirostris]